MKKPLILLCAAVLATLASWAQQAKQPRIMVRPAEVWCTEHGYTKVVDDQGSKLLLPQYEVALQADGDLHATITKIEALMNDRQFPPVNFLQAIRSVRARAARNSGLAAKETGAGIASSFMDDINQQAKADIYFDLYWKINTAGLKRSVTYTLSAYDAYTNKAVASTSGTGEPSYTAEVPLLVEEAVTEQMDAFLARLQGHFDDLRENGREVSLEINCFDGCGIDMEKDIDGKELREVIEDWMSDNTVKRAYSLVDDTETTMLFQDVRIALYDTRERPQDAGQFARELRKYLETTLGVPVKMNARTLGRAQLIIGAK